MALQFSVTEDGHSGLPNTGVPHSEAYAEIIDFQVTIIHGVEDTGVTIVEFGVWHDVATHNAGDDPFFTKRYELPPGPINFAGTIGEGFAALYGYAQAVPESDTGLSFFDGAVTV